MLDPISTCELALALGMSIAEMCHGAGTPMSAHEMTVIWPAFFAWRERARAREERRASLMQGSKRMQS